MSTPSSLSQAMQWLPQGLDVLPGQVLSVLARHDTYSCTFQVQCTVLYCTAMYWTDCVVSLQENQEPGVMIVSLRYYCLLL